MDFRTKQIELIAPAGSFEALTAAIQNGASAVYFGIEQLNMRAVSSVNFELSDLPHILTVCKEGGVKGYLTLNTVMYDHDLVLSQSILAAAKEAGVDAIIACDPAVIMEASRYDLPVHISTQANVTNINAVKFYSRYADAVVLSRELGLKQIAEIAKRIERENIRGVSGRLLELEVFVHGALCMAVSGKCYLSVHSDNSSANRGACKQNCRKKYTVIDEDGTALKLDNEYIMSPKDLCTIFFLDEVLKTGVTKLKIEGRARAADYVAVVTRCYSEALEAIRHNKFNSARVSAWTEELRTVYNRDFWEGYYLGRHLGAWTQDGAGSQASKKKIYVGLGEHYFTKAQVAQFKLEAFAIKEGDELLIIGPTTGVRSIHAQGLIVNDVPAKTAKKGETFTMKVGFKVRTSDKLYKLVT